MRSLARILRTRIYLRFALFLLPLIITIFVQETAIQWIAAGLARLPMPVESLAAFGLAWGISTFLTGPLVYSKQMSLVLVERKQSFWRALHFILIVAGVVTAIQALLALTEPGRAFLLQVHRISPDTSRLVRTLLVWLLAHPLLKGVTHVMMGSLIRNHQTQYVSFASVTGFGAVAIVTLLFLQHPPLHAQPILLPVAALYAWQLAELGVVAVGILRHRQRIWQTPPHRQGTPSHLTLPAIFRFFWPLAGMVLMQEFSRPLINLFIARQPAGELNLAVIAVVYALGQWPYRWVNETRNLAASFLQEDPRFRALGRFNLSMGLLSILISMTLYWTPLREWILLSLMAIAPDLAERAGTPLRLFTFFAVAVTLRSYLQGIGLVERRTPSMLPSALLRQVAVILSLLILPLLGLAGATMGVLALLSGFLVEAITLLVALRGPALRARLMPAVANAR